jgi:uncharacterized DUF497 family protein
MERFEWSDAKNLQLKQERGISFEEIVFVIEHGGLVDVVPHSNLEKYPNQLVYVINVIDYIYLVPFVKDDTGARFLTTIIPSRKATKRYLGENKP